MYSIISGGIQTAYEVTAPMLMFCQGMMLLEIAHAVFGLVRSGIMAPALQVELLEPLLGYRRSYLCCYISVHIVSLSCHRRVI